MKPFTSGESYYGAALQAFAADEGAVMSNGTWIIGDLLRRSRERGSYTAVPFPQLYGRSAMWADNHVMVLLKGGTSDARSRHAALAFLKFLYDEGGVWSRTGQLPTRRSVVVLALTNQEVSSAPHFAPHEVAGAYPSNPD